MDTLENKILRVLKSGVPTGTGNLQTATFSVQAIARAIEADAIEVEKALTAMEGRGQVNSVPGYLPPAERQWSIR